MADLRGGPPGMCAPSSGPKFLYFHAVFKKNWLNSRLANPLRGWHTPLWEIPDPPLGWDRISEFLPELW